MTPEQVDRALAKKLDELRNQFEADSRFPDVIALWEAMGRIARRNLDCSSGGMPYPFPAWINSYLCRGAEKISRLWLGIHPNDDQSLIEKGISGTGELRKVPHGKKDGTSKLRYRDVRTDHVASALGFVQKGRSAFQHHDKSTRDADYLSIYDDRSLQDNEQLRRDVRGMVIGAMETNEGITEPAARNRLSKARRKSHRTSAPIL
jgi:hypothetical protein